MGVNDQPSDAAGDSPSDGIAAWPRADSSSKYYSTLKESADSYPHVTDALMRADRHRPRRWQQFIDRIDLRAVDLLLDYLLNVSRSLTEVAETRDLKFLPDRIADDFRISVEGLLSGHLQIASDAMRDVMETEFLVRDFALDPNQVNVWRNADENMLRRRFRPVHLRQRQAEALGVDTKNVPGAVDYSAHSELLHVNRPLLFPRSPESGAKAGHRAINILNCLADIMYHGSSAVEALNSFLGAIKHSRPDPNGAQAALASASDDLSTARSAVEAMERLTAESLRTEGNIAVNLFESGLVIAVDRDATTARFYRTDRVDFRTFHRSVTEDRAASFQLISLEDAVKDNQEPSDP